MPPHGTVHEIPVTSLSSFSRRHIGLTEAELEDLVNAIGADSLDTLIDAVVPEKIRFKGALGLPEPLSEAEALRQLRSLADANLVSKSYIGLGYYPTVTPPAIQRNILENPGWYTAYTPYQAEISQGRLEALLNFQTMIIDLTGMEIANASLLDEATAAAEAMTMCHGIKAAADSHAIFVSDTCHPQTIEVVRTRARALGIDIVVGNHHTFDFSRTIFAALVQYPATDGTLHDYRAFIQHVHANSALA